MSSQQNLSPCQISNGYVTRFSWRSGNGSIRREEFSGNITEEKRQRTVALRFGEVVTKNLRRQFRNGNESAYPWNASAERRGEEP